MVRVPTASTTTISDSDDTSSQDQSIILRDNNHSNGFIRTNFNENGNNNDDDDLVNRLYEQSHHQIRIEENTFESKLSLSSVLIWNAYESYKEILLGTCAGVCVFLTVILVFLILRRKSRSTIDKASLIDNEVSVNVDVDRLTIHV